MTPMPPSGGFTSMNWTTILATNGIPEPPGRTALIDEINMRKAVLDQLSQEEKAKLQALKREQRQIRSSRRGKQK